MVNPMPRIAQTANLNRNEKRAAIKASQDRNDGRPLLTVMEAAGHIKMSKRTIYRLIHSGQLRSIQVSGRLRIRHSDLDDYLDNHITS
jgi:excisionase family DNA binding protein